MKNSIFYVVIFFCSPVFAWGNFGHQVVGEIASRHLCAKTSRAVGDLLGGESLAEAATWADDVRSQPEFSYMKPWHFVTMELNTRYQDAPKAPRGDLVSAFREEMKNLKNGLYPKRAEALRLIVHFAGDAHQPFHAGMHRDGGGNGVILTWFGYPSNLHKVWDTRMIKKLGLSFTELANFLDKPSAPSPTQGTPEDWVTESSKIASEVYPENTELGYAYHDKYSPVAKDRLLTAGLRLANLLNETFGCR
jgi:hypothetical protein